jgi:hypothetical protein
VNKIIVNNTVYPYSSTVSTAIANLNSITIFNPLFEVLGYCLPELRPPQGHPLKASLHPLGALTEDSMKGEQNVRHESVNFVPLNRARRFGLVDRVYSALKEVIMWSL